MTGAEMLYKVSGETADDVTAGKVAAGAALRR